LEQLVECSFIKRADERGIRGWVNEVAASCFRLMVAYDSQKIRSLNGDARQACVFKELFDPKRCNDRNLYRSVGNAHLMRQRGPLESA
jgi:hypothetical protein